MHLRHLIVLIIDARNVSTGPSCKLAAWSSGLERNLHHVLQRGRLIGQIKKPEFTCCRCLSPGCGSNKQRSISLRCRKIRPTSPSEGAVTAKLAL